VRHLFSDWDSDNGVNVNTEYNNSRASAPESYLAGMKTNRIIES
jgi:hypothetical protein